MKLFALTTAFNEDLFLPRWIAYYRTQLGAENIFIIDHGSTDLSTINLQGASVLRVPRSKFSDGVKSDSSSYFHQALLQYYDGGFVCDVDEFITPNPEKYKGLQDFIERTDYDSLCGIGLEVLHIPEREPDYLPHLPILSQRRTVFFNSKICKHLYSRKPVRFGGGFHASTNKIGFDPDLYLFHMKNFDYKWRLARQRVTRAWDYVNDFGTHARWDDDEAKLFVDRLIESYKDNIEPGFDFSAEIVKTLMTAGTYQHDGRPFYETDPYGFFGEKSRLVPPSFAHLF